MSLTEKLIQKGKRLALAGVLGSSLYFSGCGPALMGIGAGAAVRGNPAGVVLQALGTGVTQIEAAQEGKDEVNQRVEIHPSYQAQATKQIDGNVPVKDIKAFICKNASDIDGNGFITYPFEFKGICDNNNNIFDKDEIINLVMEVPQEPRSLHLFLDVVIMDKKDNLVYKSNKEAKCGYDRWFIERTPAERLNQGEYKVYWSSGNFVFGEAKFKIAESKLSVSPSKYKLSAPPLNTN